MTRPPKPSSRRLALGQLMLLGSAPWLAGPSLAADSDNLLDYAPRAKAPPGYPESYIALVRAAEDEGRLCIYTNTDKPVAAPLVADFQSLYPRIAVDYEDLGSTELYHRFIAERQLGRASADVLWSSAMDHMAALATAGHAQPYDSPEKSHYPDWARWQDRLWSTTYEPVVFAHHKPSLPASRAPRSHKELASWLAHNQGRTVSYDILKSGIGYFLAAQDEAADAHSFWSMAKELGKRQTRLVLTTDAQASQLASGKASLGINLLGSYTLAQARKRPTLGILYPQDYTLIASRVLLINSKAAHPNAARLWLDYLLSRRGQSLMARSAGLYALRADAEGETTRAVLLKQLGDRARPIALSPQLAAPLDNASYNDFILRWRTALGQARVRRPAPGKA
ncbi:ABC transporter substrate-binding protein [Comamonas composti]|uniref:ABC transporter substrate-binding protein n=1 Tax=Comamonas composti TaxID=408558 RepID=UPI0006882548|nr:ABC transporter substrate-binding protein [Comamonas composti]